jgi:hypothetical protein
VSVVDYYGTEWKVEPIMGGPGPMVDVTVGDEDRFHRFTAEDACDLADELVRAAGFPQKATRP